MTVNLNIVNSIQQAAMPFIYDGHPYPSSEQGRHPERSRLSGEARDLGCSNTVVKISFEAPYV